MKDKRIKKEKLAERALADMTRWRDESLAASHRSRVSDKVAPPPDVAEYLRHLAKERDVSPNTVQAYDRDLREFVGIPQRVLRYRWLELGEASTGSRCAASSRISRGAASASARCRARFPACEASIGGCIATRWSRRIPRAPSAPRSSTSTCPGYLDRPQIDLLFQMAEARAMEGNFTDVRNLAILELFYSTGMRLSELQGLSRGDPDLVSQQVKVRGKGRKERIIPIGDHAVLALRNYEAKRDELLRGVGPQGGAVSVLPFAHGQAHRRADGAEGRVGIPRGDR